MATIEKRGTERKPRYVVRWRAPDGKSRQQTFTRRRDAEDHRDSVGVHKSAGTYVDRSEGRMLYDEWARIWLADQIEHRPSTRATYESVMRAQVLPSFGHVPLGAIEQQMVQEWVHGMVAAGKSAATVDKAYRLLAGSLAAAVDKKRLRATPCVGVRLPRVETDEMRFLDHGEVARLAEAMPDRYRALVLVLAYGGLRIGEATALRRHRVDPLRRTVKVERTAVEVRGHWTENAPKTRAGRRTVQLPRPVMEALTEHAEAYGEPGPQGLLFTAEQGGPLRVATWRRRVWAPVVARAELEPLRIHDLRHTAVALWIAGGASLLQVKQLAGHTRSTFTLDRYGHLYEDAHDGLMDVLETAMVPLDRGGRVVDLARRTG